MSHLKIRIQTNPPLAASSSMRTINIYINLVNRFCLSIEIFVNTEKEKKQRRSMIYLCLCFHIFSCSLRRIFFINDRFFLDYISFIIEIEDHVGNYKR